MGQHTVLVLAEDGVFLNIAQGVVHPAHVPLVGKAETVFREIGDVRPHGGFLCDGQHVGMILPQAPVELAEEGDGLQILVAAVAVGMPLAVAAVVVEVEHGRYRVHAQAVGVEFLHPVVGVGYEEGDDLGPSHVKAAGAPAAVFLPRGVAVFVEGLSVKVEESVCVAGEVGGDPVKDDADARTVQDVHEGAEVVGVAIAGGGGVIAADLIAPGAAEGVLHDGQKLHVGVAHLLDVGSQLVRQLAVGEGRSVRVMLPGADVQLVGVKGVFATVGGAGSALAHPAAVVPDEGRFPQKSGGREGRALHGPPVRIGAQIDLSVGGLDAVFIGGAVGHALAGQGEQIETVLGHTGHGDTEIPVGKGADHRDRPRVRCPDAEDHLLGTALDGGVALGVRTEIGPGVTGVSRVEDEFVKFPPMGSRRGACPAARDRTRCLFSDGRGLRGVFDRFGHHLTQFLS